ncbi:MAG TPA: polynucleotide adenylyltransferase PcnB [Burkholderiaceae bacterium]|nr:polynucleotide adenylyltransferase PcnB [Burkholderiaceae bacterium]
MIRKFIDKLLGKPAATGKGAIPLGKRVEVPAAEHGIDPALLDDRAVRVVRTLQEGGHAAYIVGGAVRDLLVGRRPKDFDVATNATPEQVKALFRRAFIIGRRFRIVHVIFGRGRDHEVVEVSTFRAYLEAGDAEQVEGNEKTSRSELAGKSHVVDASGRVLRDNVWGPQVEDAARRDFTINAMYYDPVTQVVVDYHHGLRDLKKKTLRMIGDPATRYREDPVRVIRAVRFAAKLGFEIEPATRSPIGSAAALLDAVPQSRLFDEMIKLLQTGHALASVAELRKQGLTRLFPLLVPLMEDGVKHKNQRVQFIEAALADTDARVGDGRSVAPSFLLACLVWHEVRERWQAGRDAGVPVVPALHEAVDAVFDARIGDVSGRGKLGADMREIWLMQPRFERRSGSGPYSLVEQPRFRAAYDFLRLRADTGEVDPELAEWWEDFSLGSPEDREALIATVREAHRQSPRRTGGRSGAAPAEAGAAASEGEGGVAPADEAQAPARKRRRRRRKPGTSGGAAGGEAAS